MLSLPQLGDRIIVLGPSNAGKSTLAIAISEQTNLPVVHLDQLQHLPNTDWQARSEAEFKALHDEAIIRDRWVMDGNYSRLMPQRLERATGIILLTSNRWLRLARYIKRSLSKPTARAGSLDGGPEYVKWEMIDWILFKTPSNSVKYARMIDPVPVPKIKCGSVSELKALYEACGLRQPGA
ncbi:MAG: isopentenyl transferase family protein [Pseudomonadota bacterium]